jgi:serine/threonine protein phosphatase PrpC
MKIQLAYKTDPGKVRESNEDSVATRKIDDHENINALLIVADGVGGNIAGEVASEFTSEKFLDMIMKKEKAESPGIEQLLKSVILEINDELINIASMSRDKSGMATTIVCGIIANDKLFFAWAGDSRAYLVRDGIATQLTEDHSFVNELIKSGVLTPEQAKTHPRRNVIIKSLGKDPDLEVDINNIELEDGDRILFCTDGLTGHVADDELAYLVGYHSMPDKSCDSLVKLANDRGGKDNISVIVTGIGDAKPVVPSKPAGLKKSQNPTLSDTLLIVVMLIVAVIIAIFLNGVFLKHN